MKKLFGTDGVRGYAGRTLTPQMAFRLGQAAGTVFRDNGKKVDAIIGRDTRLSGDMLEGAITAGLNSVGVGVAHMGVAPTPAVAYAARVFDYQLGVVISASHNPYYDNGIKFFDGNGYKLSDEKELAIEGVMLSESDIPMAINENIGKVLPPRNERGSYEKFILGSINADVSKMRVVLDCANGASSHMAPEIFTRAGAHVIAYFNSPDGININDKCGSTDIRRITELTLQHGADIGFAFDGDADRLICVDDKGNPLDGDEIVALFAVELKSRGKLGSDTVVATVMSNQGVENYLRGHGINMLREQVGDKYVLERMISGGYNLGGEQSGHVILLDHNTTGDGVLAAALLLELVAAKGMPLSKLRGEIEHYPQILINVKVKEENKKAYQTDDEIRTVIGGVNRELNGRGRVLVRHSGTEPLIRVMVEGAIGLDIDGYAINIAEKIKKRLE